MRIACRGQYVVIVAISAQDFPISLCFHAWSMTESQFSVCSRLQKNQQEVYSLVPLENWHGFTSLELEINIFEPPNRRPPVFITEGSELGRFDFVPIQC